MLTLSEFKNILPTLENITFTHTDKTPVPAHFHVTEVGLVTKKFIDCGGTIRTETVINFQLWSAKDFDHRLAPQKLQNIIELSEQKLNLPDEIIEVEYQSDTIGRYRLAFVEGVFILLPQKTNCLAQDKCGISPDQLPTESNNSCCSAGRCC